MAITLEDIALQLHRIQATLAKLCVPVDVLHTAEVARRLGRTERTVMKLFAATVFTDARPPGKRCGGSARLTYADEVEVYRSDGPAGVRRLRRELGRLA